MKNISLIFLLITISVCVFFNAQPDRWKQTDHTETDDECKETVNMQKLGPMRKMKEAALDTGQRKGEVYPKKRQSSVADQEKDRNQEKKDAISNKRTGYKQNSKDEVIRYIHTSRAISSKSKSRDGLEKEKFKEDSFVKHNVKVSGRDNSKDEEGRSSQARRAVREKKISIDSRQREINKMDKYFQNSVTVDAKRATNRTVEKGSKVQRSIHDSMTVINKFKNQKFEFDKIQQHNALFGGNDYTEHLFRYHHTIQKRDVDRLQRINQADNDEKEINKNACSIGKSDVERNCESLFKCCHNKNKTNPNCYCDELCPLFDDCCHDSNETSLNVSETYRLLMPRIQCKPVKRLPASSTYQVVATCPGTYTNKNISKNCEITFSTGDFDFHFEAPVNDPLLIVPVTDLSQVTYKNIFCAVCNDISDVRLWTMKYPIDIIETLNVSNIDEYIWEEFPSLQNYVMVFPPEDLPVRFCNGYTRKNKHEEGQVVGSRSDTNQCYSLRLFLNVTYLYLEKSCLTAAWEYEYCSPDHVVYTNCSDCVPHEFSSDNTRWSSYGMHVLFTFNMANDGCDNSYKISASGEENPLYICPTSTLLNPYYVLECYFRIAGNLSQNTFDFMGTALFSYVNALTDSEIYLKSNIRLVYQNTECDIQLIKMSLTYLTETDYNYWNKVTSWYDDLNWTYTELHDSGKVVVSKVSSTSIPNIMVCDFSRSKNEISTMFIKENSAIFQYLPRTQRFCRNVNFTLEINNPDASVSDQLNELMVSESECSMAVPSSQNYFDDVLTVVSSVLMGTGCITLICSLVSNVVLNADVAIPGLITRHMMITTLLFQFLFIVGIGATDNFMMCLAFGVALHYSSLCAFAWMSICLGYLANTLMKIKKLPGNMNGRDRKSRYLLICFGYILPTFIVIPSIIIDTCQCTSFTIDYGTGVCFPNPNAYPEGLLVFIGPISVHILFNIVCLTVSIQELSRAKVNVAALSISRSYTPIYLKLSVYSGIGWVFGIATLVLPFDIVKFLFIVSCSSQGLFLSVITLCNIRVLRRLRSQLSTSNKGN